MFCYCESCGQMFDVMLPHSEPDEPSCPLCGADEGAIYKVDSSNEATIREWVKFDIKPFTL